MDTDALFGDDYLHFYEPRHTPEANEREADQVERLLGLGAGARVLDAPCGYGRLSLPLARRGMVVTGLDTSEVFLARARWDAAQAGLPVRYVRGDLRSLPVTGPFDGVVNWFTSFGYHDDAELRATLRDYRRVLAPGGRLLIDTVGRDAFVRRLVDGRIAYVEAEGDDLMIDQSTFDPATDRLDAVRTVVRGGRVRRSRYFVRLPTVAELSSWLREAGFTAVSCTDRDGLPFKLESNRLVVVATADPVDPVDP